MMQANTAIKSLENTVFLANLDMMPKAQDMQFRELESELEKYNKREGTIQDIYFYKITNKGMEKVNPLQYLFGGEKVLLGIDYHVEGKSAMYTVKGRSAIAESLKQLNATGPFGFPNIQTLKNKQITVYDKGLVPYAIKLTK